MSKLSRCRARCSVLRFLCIAILIQLSILCSLAYLFATQFETIDAILLGRNLTISAVYIQVSTITLSLTTLCWLIVKLIRLRCRKFLSNKKHICMAVCIVAALTSLLYAFIVSFTIYDALQSLGLYFLLNAFTFCVASVTLIVEMIKPTKNYHNEADKQSTRSNSSEAAYNQNQRMNGFSIADKLFNNSQSVNELPHSEKEAKQYLREKGRRVSFVPRSEFCHLARWANQLESIANSEDFRSTAQKIASEMRLRSRFYSGRQSEQIFTSSYARHSPHINGRLIEED